MAQLITIEDLAGKSRKINIDELGRIVTQAVISDSDGNAVDVIDNQVADTKELAVNLRGFECVCNSTDEPLGANLSFEGEWINTLDYGTVVIGIISGQDSAIDGLVIQWSANGVDIVQTDEFSIFANKGKVFTFGYANKYIKIKYTNGSTIQTDFHLQTIHRRVYVKPSSHRINDSIIGQDDAELMQSVLKVQTNDEKTYKNVDVQNPLPTDGDSVYGKDLYLTESDPGDFIITLDPTADETAILTSMVSDVWVEKKNDTATNPKLVTLAFRRPVLTTSFGIDSGPDGDFSNVKIYVMQGQAEFLIVDESADNTKYQIRLFSTAPLKFSAIRFEFHTSDTVTTGLYGIFKHSEVAARLQAISELTEAVEDVSSYRGALNVNSAWVHRKIVNETFHQHTANITNPTNPISEGDTSFVVDDATGFVTLDEIKIEEGSLQEIGILTLTDVTGTTFTLDRPLANDYTTAAEIIEVSTNMAAIAGTLASPQIYEIDPPPLTIWQITRILFTITDNLAPDDGKFGGIPALENGVVIRAITAAGRVVAFANWKTNGDMRRDMYDVTFTDKAPAGNHGVNGRWTFTKAEVVAELDGNGTPIQSMQILIQDDLTDLLTFTMKAQGRVFSP